VRRLVFLFIALAVLPATSKAQIQRLALAFGEYVARAGSSVEIPTFCIDPNRKAPPENTVFHYSYGDAGSTVISYKGADYSPSQAAASGIGEFLAGDDFDHAIFRPKVPGDVRIRVKSGTYLSEVDEPIPVARTKILNGLLSTSKPKRTSLFADGQQGVFWDRVEISDEQTILRDLGLYNGNIDGLSGPKLRRAQSEFTSKSGEEADLNGMLNFVSRTNANLSDDGQRIFASEMRTRVGRVGFHGDDGVKRFREYHNLPDGLDTDQSFFEALRADEEIVAAVPFHVWFADGQRQFLVENRGLEVWNIEKGILTDRLRGRAAVDAVEKNSASAVQRASKDGKTYIYPFTFNEDDSSISFQFGNEKISESRADVEAFISGTGSLPRLEAALDSANNGGGGKPRIFVYRGLMSDDIPNPGGVAIPISSALSSVSRRQMNVSKFASEMRSKYGDRAEVFLASDSDIAAKHADSISPVKGPKDLAVLKGEKVEDWGAVDEIVQSLKKAKIPLIQGDDENFEAGNVMILTGHRDRNLAAYLEELLENGTLREKIVLLFSCYGAMCESSHTELLQSRYGPKAILFFPDEINKNAATVVIKELIEQLGSPGYSPAHLADVLNLSVDKAATKYPPLRDEILKLRNLIVQVSDVHKPEAEKQTISAD
jgi:peptidoglycan hydrolase-like protein with peptidoglycan-binding domain